MDTSLQTRGALRTGEDREEEAPLGEDHGGLIRAQRSEPLTPSAPGQVLDSSSRSLQHLRRKLCLSELLIKQITENKVDMHSLLLQVLPSYSMKSEKRGTCLIINNENFRSMKKREGTMMDEECVFAVFEWLNFEVKVHRDCDRRTILSIIKETAAEDHSQVDSLVCMVFSHGDEGRVFGVDGRAVMLQELTAPFTGSKCPSLAGKPKMFFIQACQGEKNNDPVTIEADSGVVSDAVKPPTIPSESDFLLAKSTVPTFYSYRNVEQGSWFIQSLCGQVFILVPRTVDLLSILTKVNEDVSEKDVGSRKQMPEFVSSLRKKVVFPNPNAPVQPQTSPLDLSPRPEQTTYSFYKPPLPSTISSPVKPQPQQATSSLYKPPLPSTISSPVKPQPQQTTYSLYKPPLPSTISSPVKPQPLSSKETRALQTSSPNKPVPSQTYVTECVKRALLNGGLPVVAAFGPGLCVPTGPEGNKDGTF
ncbi:caspase-like [Synchiropus splendidus]|uniref:caspase-like n=1 Tax=Synchiropus splendidus TaxID=270530 RepID=UPI00237E3CC6|nr:caspase-like [Synchiropus splendidus]